MCKLQDVVIGVIISKIIYDVWYKITTIFLTRGIIIIQV